MSDRDLLPADRGTRYAVRFYAVRLAILGGGILLAVLVPALTVLFHNGSHASSGIVVLLVVLAFFAFGSTVRQRGALSPGTAAFAPTPRINWFRVLVAAVARMLRRR